LAIDGSVLSGWSIQLKSSSTRLASPWNPDSRMISS
jgi:hypothetical protein